MRLRALGALTASVALFGGIAPQAVAQAAAAPQSTAGTAPTEFYLAHGNTASVNGGTIIDSTSPNVSVSANLESVTVSTSSWELSLSSSAALAPGTYTSGVSLMSTMGSAYSCSTGSFTIIEMSATDVNATFSLDCGPTASVPDNVGFVRYNATLATPVPTTPSDAQPITDPPNSGTTSANADEFSFISAQGDYIGGGSPADYTGSNVVVNGSQGVANVDAGGWTLNLSAPAGGLLVPGTYVGATRYPFNSSSAPGVSLYGDGRGCNNDYGTFTIYQIASDSTGALSQLNATFSQTCEQTTAPPLVGFIRYNATEPTPVPAFLTASLKPSTGTAQSDGETNVTLAASGNATAGASYSYNFGDGATATVSSDASVTKPEWEGTYPVSVTVTDAGQTYTTPTQWLTVGDGYHAVAPQRIMDTRKGQGANGPIQAMHTVTLPLPSSITSANHGPIEAVVLNVTVTGATAGGNIKVYSTGLSQVPTTSNVNFGAGQTVANQVTVALVPGGQLVFNVQENPGTVQLIADVEGYYTSGNDSTNSGYAAVTPKRLIDTRSKTGGIGGRLPAWGHVRYTLPSSVPAGATAVAFNVTAVNAGASGDLKVYPDSSTIPNISNLNFAKGNTVPNLVIVQVPASRVIDFYLDSNGSADLLVDLEGYYSTSATAKFVPMFPTRLFDTRTNFLPGPLQSGEWLITSMSYIVQVPTSALKAALYNVTVTQPQNDGNIIVAPDPPTSLPITSNVNFGKGATVANSALGAMFNGKQDFFNESYGTTQLIADVFGYFATPLASSAPPSTPNVAATSAQGSLTPMTHAMSKAQVLAKQ
jgi:hypothetical protein